MARPAKGRDDIQPILTVTPNPCIDETLFVDRLSLHDTNRAKRVEWDAGGKGINVARIISSLGGRAIATGLTGGDTGAAVEAVLRREGVDCQFVLLNIKTRTNVCVEDGSELPPTTIESPGPEMEPGELDALLAITGPLASCSAWLMTGGSLPPGLPVDTHAQLIRVAHDQGIPAAVDADGEPLRAAMTAGPQFIKPNVHEAERLTGRHLESLSQIADCATELRSQMIAAGASEHATAVISMGASGAVMACRKGAFRGISPGVVSRSSVGSGDSMVGAMLWRLAGHDTPQVAFRWGLAAGAATARTRNVGVATREEIEELLPTAVVEPL